MSTRLKLRGSNLLKIDDLIAENMNNPRFAEAFRKAGEELVGPRSGYQEAKEDIKLGKIKEFDSVDELFEDLESDDV